MWRTVFNNCEKIMSNILGKSSIVYVLVYFLKDSCITNQHAAQHIIIKFYNMALGKCVDVYLDAIEITIRDVSVKFDLIWND
jgi:hypothetical protein